MSLPASLLIASRPRPARISAEQQPAFRAYVKNHYRGFLLAINLIAMIAYDLYVFADALLIPDMALESLLLRGGLSLVGLVNIYLVFRYSRSVLLMDMLMPIHDIISTIAWFELLKRSESPDVASFLFASVVFVLLANLGVRYSFRGILACSLVISAITLGNVWLLYGGDSKAVLIYVLVFLPVALFSLFISWTNIRSVKRAFLADQEERQQRAELATLTLQLQELAHTDPLTLTGNRRAFDHAMQLSWQQMQQGGRPFALLLVDIDYFKPYNDHYGHQAGDTCLRQVAESMLAAMRSGQAKLYRYGGEEFAILLDGCRRSELQRIAERLRQQVEGLGLAHQHRVDRLGHITISIGAVLASPAQGEIEQLLKGCDELLYRAKQEGRNRVCMESTGDE
ncbi:GGDEF domain-containing protein [Pseudomonas sp. Gutcm_11s]|uniref:GGDEF domain-containing protein n=1 Tax=Pseudomonas sp. Gutcm_11s TaxID=3026088 RepID=UPI00235DC453|nr:GGDEF domain-containing protein [Pseudomonas sp. Gutcm_11s]MDD0844174.1 GGDEF domain-containing protein [Pseudomonas sp. Gutcm_11s]